MKKGVRVRSFKVVSTLLALVLVAGVVFTMWFAYHIQQVADKTLDSANRVAEGSAVKVAPTAPVTSFADCQKAAGSKILQSYPAQCVTKSGKTFADTTKYLVIKEWGVKIPLTADEGDLIPVGVTSEGVTFYGIRSPSIAKLCGAGWNGEIGRIGRSLTDPSKQGSYEPQVKIGSYYYTFAHIQNACSDDDTIARQDSNASTALQAQFKLLQAE